ncbi:surface protein [Klebsiella pneumoniae subsp. ozaenae]|uniref:Surface protein n=1 Tax=Klebsiella pneumoniae subsp. ozaenae TaxID=574 RepID=A0A378A056_KLEPO|nr:surface protein [Klebsiella pneumoniae subsp. ozaenae]
MSLRQIVLNRRGMIVAVVVTASSLLGGILNAFILGLPLKTGLAMASGFGWYSLSGILLTESFGRSSVARRSLTISVASCWPSC